MATKSHKKSYSRRANFPSAYRRYADLSNRTYLVVLFVANL